MSDHAEFNFPMQGGKLSNCLNPEDSLSRFLYTRLEVIRRLARRRWETNRWDASYGYVYLSLSWYITPDLGFVLEIQKKSCCLVCWQDLSLPFLRLRASWHILEFWRQPFWCLWRSFSYISSVLARRHMPSGSHICRSSQPEWLL